MSFNDGEIQVFHKTAMGNLSQLWNCGNLSRMNSGKSPANLTKFLKSSKTQEFIEAVEGKHGIKAMTVSGKGSQRKTWACIQLMIYAAEKLCVNFHLEVIDAFVNSRILELRDGSGDGFVALNQCINNYLPEREGKSNKGVFIQVAKMLNTKILDEGQSWNSATAQQLKERLKIEDTLSEMLRLGMIKNYEHLKHTIEKL
jgi:hypothetical protein